jgi:hypothetical protein
MGIDGLLQESEPDGFTDICTLPSSISVLTVAQPPSLDEQFKDTCQQLFVVIDLLDSQHAHMNPDWYAKFCDSGTRFFKFVEDNICDETCRMLLKMNV